jgi:carboxyl-terminal processing protease
LEKEIGYIAFNAFLDPGYMMPIFNEAMQSFMNYSGVIIDLRGNNGGIGAMAIGMGGWFVKEKERYFGTMYMRGAQLKVIVQPRPETFGGPLAILVDEMSVSAAEFLSGGLKDLGRARIFGTRTPGVALPSIIERLPNGDGFQYALGNYISAGGEALEGKGVLPNQEVTHTREALLQGKDLVLAAAVGWIRSQSNHR